MSVTIQTNHEGILMVILRSARPLVFLAAACAFAAPFAFGPVATAEDVVTKTDGAKLRGKVISDTPDEVKIKTAGGVITVPRGEVSTVDRAKDLASELASRQGTLDKHPSAQGFLDLAHWCEEHELFIAQADALQKALKLDPENETARTALGFRRLKGHWVTESEYFKDQGYTQIEGRWVSPAEKEKLDQGLVRSGDDEWITKEEAERREKEATARSEKDRQGVPAKPGDTAKESGTTAEASKPARPAKKGKEDKPRFVDGKLLYTKSRETIVRMLDQIGQEAVPALAKPKN